MGQSVRKETKGGSRTGSLKKSTRAAKVDRQKSNNQAGTRENKYLTQKPRRLSSAARERTIEEFKRLVNISRVELERWLKTPESIKLGASSKLRTPAEQRPGATIAKVVAKRQDKITNEDVELMRSVVAFIQRRLQERPRGNIVASNWRFSLMNWGHDPAKPLKRKK